MRIATITGKFQGTVADRPDPQPKNDVVVVKVHAAPMCTEYTMFRDGEVSDRLGHEAAGEVVAVDRCSRLKVGDRVIVQPQSACGSCPLCHSGAFIHCTSNRDLLGETDSAAGGGTMAQYLLQSEAYLTPIPEGLGYEHAAMACCGLGPTFGGMQAMQVDAFDTVLISGLGPVGLGGVINARQRGAQVIGVDSNPYRAELARRLGARAIIDPRQEQAAQQVRDLTGGRGADKALETSGTAVSKPFLLDAVRRRGQIAFIGWKGQLDVDTIIQKGLTLHGTWHYNQHDVPRLLQVIHSLGSQLDQLITHRFPLEQVQQAWELQVGGQCGKVILRPWA